MRLLSTMARYIFLSILLITALYARENPFFPAEGSDVSLTTNIITQVPPLKRASITLPSTARTVESVTVSYKNLDGTISEKTIQLSNSIDWHLPLFISQNYCNERSAHKQTRRNTTKKLQPYVEVAHLAFVRFKVRKNEIFVQTNDAMLRSFLLARPHRIVCDFKRDTDIRSFVKKVNKANVVQIRVGTHKGYYRVVIELDGNYRYTIKKTKNGYIYKLM